MRRVGIQESSRLAVSSRTRSRRLERFDITARFIRGWSARSLFADDRPIRRGVLIMTPLYFTSTGVSASRGRLLCGLDFLMHLFNRNLTRLRVALQSVDIVDQRENAFEAQGGLVGILG